ncbi:toll-like receptor 4 [Haliotis rubra]|uniref:toll-like receptor 4 n=1 Tax=Haliotis rubra TaxID=36100 RepID=UPI001EE57502|nr:toll-like receptor 4 [Haliotis rubra]
MGPLPIHSLLMLWAAFTINGMLHTEQDTVTCSPCICQTTSAVIRPFCNLTSGGVSAHCTNVSWDFIHMNIPNRTTQLFLIRNNLSVLTEGMFSRFTQLQLLNISMNELEHISSSAFLGLEHVCELNLTQNAIKRITPGTFAPLSNLSVLDISNNRGIGLEGIGNITSDLKDLPIRKLVMNSVVAEYAVCIIMKNAFIQNLNYTNLEEFHADGNSIQTFGSKAFEYFPKSLRKLSLRENKLTFGEYLSDISNLTGLEEVDLSGLNHAHELPDFSDLKWLTTTFEDCQSDNVCESNPIIFSSNYADIFSHHSLTTGEGKPIPVPPKLKTFVYAYSQLAYHIGNITFSPNVLDHVDLSSNILSTWTGPVTGLEDITFLDINNNVAKAISQTFFHTFPNLQILDVSFNFMGNVLQKDTDGDVFLNQRKLQILNLTSNFISHLTKNVFKSLVSIEILKLGSNIIHPDLDIELEHMINLTSLVLTSNQIRWLGLSTRESLDKIAARRPNIKLEVDLSNNPLSCTCYNLHFLNWIRTAHIIKFVSLSNYYCLFSSGRRQNFTDLDTIYSELEKSCHNHFGIYLGVVALFIMIVPFIVCSIAYRYRWKLRYWYYAARLRYSNTTDSGNDPLFEFDAFVSFDDEDRDFVVNDLLQKLEVEAGLRLNIHQRNFTPGRQIAANILEAVKKSKRTLLVLSRESLKSYWCMYELQMANMESITTGRDVLLIIMYEQIPTRDIPAEILYHIQTDSYIEYPHDGHTDIFWRTLIESLNK